MTQSTNPAGPGEGRLSFDSPEVQRMLRGMRKSKFLLVSGDDGSPYMLTELADMIEAEHEARVAAEEELAAACLAQRLLARGNDAMFKEKLAATESENARMKDIVESLAAWSNKYPKSKVYSHYVESQMHDELGQIEELAKDYVAQLLAPAPTAEAAGIELAPGGVASDAGQDFKKLQDERYAEHLARIRAAGSDASTEGRTT